MDNNERKYILSVVTPFHNTDLAYFGKCLDSMKEQTLGFENIEWVITLHNSEPEYVEEVVNPLLPANKQATPQDDYEYYDEQEPSTKPAQPTNTEPIYEDYSSPAQKSNAEPATSDDWYSE